MRKNVPEYIYYPIFSTILGLLLMNVPVISVLLLLPIMPLAHGYDWLIPGYFLETGTHVEVGFLWIFLKTPEAWFFYGSFFFLLGLGVGSFLYCYKVSKLKQWFGGIIILSGLLFALVNLLSAFIADA